MANIVTELIYKITGDNSGANKSLKDTDKQVTKTSKSFSMLKVGVVAAGGAIAGAAVALTRMVKNQLNVIDATAKMADKLGVSMEAMIGLEHIAGLTGASAEQLGMAVQMLDVRIGQSAEGIGKAESSLRQLGLSIEDVTSLEPDKAFFKVAESLQKVEDRTQQAYLAQELFGRQGRELLGVIRSEGGALSSLAGEAEKLGLTMSRGAAAEVERFNDNMFRVSQRSKGFGRQLTNELVPSLNDLAEAFLEGSEDGGVFANAMLIVSGATAGAVGLLARYINLLNGVTNAGKKAGAVSFIKGAEKEIDQTLNKYKAVAGQFNITAEEYLRAKAKMDGADSRAAQELKFVEARRKVIAQASSDTKKFDEDASASFKKAFGDGEKALDSLNKKVGESRSKITKPIIDGNTDIGKDTKETFEEMAQSFNSYAQAIGGGLNNLISAFQSYNSAVYQSKIDRLDAELEAELEAAGVSEETTLEQAQREYDIAQATGTELEKEEKRRALEKAKIEEKYRKKRAMLEYEAAVAGWELQLASAVIGVPLAVMNALVSGWAAAALNPALAGWYPALLAGLAGTAGAVQVAAIQQAKPQPPKFAEGGIVPGTSFTGDRVTAQLNSGEMVLNQSQQARLFNAANGAGGSGNITVYLGDEQIYKSLYNASKRGDLIIDARSVVTR